MGVSPMFRDEIGKVYESWTVIERAGQGVTANAYWLCRCQCGSERTIRGSSLRHSCPPCEDCKQSGFIGRIFEHLISCRQASNWYSTGAILAL